MVALFRGPVSLRKGILLGAGTLALVAAITATMFAATTPGSILHPVDPAVHVIGTKTGSAESQGQSMSAAEIAKSVQVAENSGPNGPATAGETSDTPDMKIAAAAGGSNLMNSDPAPEAKVAGEPFDVTAPLMDNFGTTVSVIGQRVNRSQPNTLSATDPCLVAWAITALPTYDGKAFLGTAQVCGATAAVFVAGSGMGSRDFAGRAADNAGTDAGSKASGDVLFGKAALHVGASATPDGSAIIMVATAH